jgi:hypothetical protein
MRLTTILALVICITVQVSAQRNDIKLSLKDEQLNLTRQVSSRSVDPVQKKTPKEKDFTFTVNPYLWTVAIGGSVQHSSSLPYYFDLNFTDAVKDWKMAAMLAGRFKYKSVSLLYDVVYLSMKPDLYVPVYTGYASGTSDIKQFVGDFSLAYRIPLNIRTIQLDFYGGVRVWSLDTKIDLTSSYGPTYSNDNSKTWVDPIIGVGGYFVLSKVWFSYFKADIGGFSVASDWTSTFAWAFGYKFSDHWNTSLGLKHLNIDYDKDKFMWDVSEYGLLLTLGYQF